MKKLLLLTFLIVLCLRPFELSAWPGMWVSNAVSATCACPNWTAPTGNLQASTNFSGATLTNVALNVANSASPDCANHASTIVENTSNGVHEVNLTATPFSVSLSAAQLTIKVWLQQGVGTRTADIQISNQSTGYMYFNVDPATGVLNLSQNNNGFASSYTAFTVPVQAGGYELVVSAAGVTATTLNVQFFNDNATGSGNSYTGDGVSGFRLWGYSVNTP